MASSPVLIIGAGISGLTLAQYLRKNGIPFRIFERDVSLSSRAGGWGVTIGWARSQFGDLLPGNIIEKLEESHVQTDAVKTGNYGRFTLFDLSTGIAKFNVPAARRMRFSRTRLREILATDIQVEVISLSKMTVGIAG
jgi:2-polyprenyl-6-methoxyphenol hydroxylase-like FAD-dependent oxidoreductase